MTTNSAVATSQDFKNFVSNRFWGENFLENYVMYSTTGSRKWGRPTLNMIRFIPMALIQGCLSPVFGSISALKNVVFLDFKNAGASLSDSFATSADCFKRIGQVFIQYISFSTPKHSEFWPHHKRFENEEDTEFVFPTANATQLADGTYSANRCIYINGINLPFNEPIFKTMIYFAFATDSNLLLFNHTMSRFDTAIPSGEFEALVNQNEPKVAMGIRDQIIVKLDELVNENNPEVAEDINNQIKAKLDELVKENSPEVAEDINNQSIANLNERGFVVELKFGTELSNPSEVRTWNSMPVVPIWYNSTELLTTSIPTTEEFRRYLKGRFSAFECYKSPTEKTTRLDEIKPCLSPSQRKLIYMMICG